MQSTHTSGKLDEMLGSKLVGTFDIPLKQMALTSLTRELNPRGVENLVKSIRANGWLTHNPPALVLSSALDNGEATSESMVSREYVVLDGNHRVGACKRLFGPDRAIPCRVYRNISPDAMRIIGDGKSQFAS